MGGHNLPSLVGIGLTDLQKIGCTSDTPFTPVSGKDNFFYVSLMLPCAPKITQERFKIPYMEYTMAGCRVSEDRRCGLETFSVVTRNRTKQLYQVDKNCGQN